MKKIFYSCAVAACCVQASAPASAAPLDAFLSANQDNVPWHGRVEAGYDLANDTVDVFKLREQDGNGSQRVGNYHGQHLSGGVAVSDRLWVDGMLWRRELTSVNAAAKVTTWQLAAQYKLLDSAGYRPSVALRLGAWGDSAGRLSKEKDVQVGSKLITSASISNPKDEQYQLDLIGTWPVSERTEVSAFAGAGSSKISFDSASATTVQDGCNYNLTFSPTHVIGTCETPAMSVRFSTPNSVYGIDVNKEGKYSARYFQAGMSAKWRNERWQVRAGYQYQSIHRDQVDAIVESRNGIAYKHNHILVADVGYKVYKNTSIFLRGEYMSNQFAGELPMAYNSLTANSFKRRYGLLSSGLVMTF